MDLKSGYPFWAVRNGLMHDWPKLQDDVRCDVAVIGGGITGALIADEMAAHGHDVVVLEQREIGWGSTAASTAMLQYEIDTPLAELSGRVGPDDARRAYLACARAIDDLAALAADLPDCGHLPQRSLYLATWRRDVADLREECARRREIGLDVHWLDPADLADQFGARAHGAILSTLGGVVDPYRMATYLLLRAQAAGARVFDRSRVLQAQAVRGGLRLALPDDASVQCKHVVVAAGYASQHWIDTPVAKNRSSYAFVTDPLPADVLGELATTMAWETARPYRYLRTTHDGRLVVGGEDDAIDIPSRRDRRVEGKARTLSRRVNKLFPRLRLEPTFSWAGTFAETDDGLPFFGAHPRQHPRLLFAMAYGGNGITYSMIGAGVLRAAIEERRHDLAALFGFARIG